MGQEPQDRAPVIPTGASGHISLSQRRCCLKANQAAASASLGIPGLLWTTTDTRIQNIPLLMNLVLLPSKKSRLCKLCIIFSSSTGKTHIWGHFIYLILNTEIRYSLRVYYTGQPASLHCECTVAADIHTTRPVSKFSSCKRGSAICHLSWIVCLDIVSELQN